MNLKERIDSFVTLGDFLSQLFLDKPKIFKGEVEEFKKVINKSEQLNPWFTKENILFSLKIISSQLTRDHIESWINPYKIENSLNVSKVAIIMAGNIPLVGFHDLLSVLISGNKAVVKLSSNDTIIIPFLLEKLVKINPDFSGKYECVDDLRGRDFDAVIATGSDNSSKYFEYYFGDIHRIIRKNRTSIAIITGEESEEDVLQLANDIFLYFGLGCRSVSKLFIPEGYNTDRIFNGLYSFNHLMNNVKYANNYEYNKAVLLIDNQDFLDNGFLLMKEDHSFHSPVSMVYYQYYNDIDVLKQDILEHEDNLQCIVSKDPLLDRMHVNFGMSQSPKLWHYSDNIDTIKFLLDI